MPLVETTMVSRRDLKSVHEEAVLQHFKAHLEAQGVILQILDRPEPPEAIVELDGERTWVEITDAFLDKKHAIGLTSGVCDDVKHIPDDGRLVVGPDEMFSTALHSVIEAKYDKKSMRAISADLGPGILLVGVFTPFTTAEEVTGTEATSIAQLVSTKPDKVFRTIYVYDGYGQRQFHVLHRQEA